MEINLSGKTALVTGASGELGRCIAKTLSDAGAHVIIHYYSNKDAAQKVVSSCGGGTQKTYLVQADITDADSVSQMKKDILKDFHLPDIIVNNAVIQYEWQPLLSQPLSDFESQFKSCVMHNVMMAKAFVPSMIEKKWGRVIAINTECAMQCEEDQSAYAAAKRGMDGALRVLAKEVGLHGITVNQVAPGWTISENRKDSEDSRAYRQKLPLRKRSRDCDVANAVLFFASDLAAATTGAYFPVCSGSVMPTI
ncbi:MAG: SDR family NAD(P)-dependent oxidoreductase [Fibrobacterota bacterium]